MMSEIYPYYIAKLMVKIKICCEIQMLANAQHQVAMAFALFVKSSLPPKWEGKPPLS